MAQEDAKEIVQTVVYRLTRQGAQVLVLKRSEERGGFWSLVNGTTEPGETPVQCRARELFEETGISQVIGWTGQLHSFSFVRNDETYNVLVFGAEVDKNASVVINEEHSEFLWLAIDEAVDRVKFQDDKAGILELKKVLSNSNILSQQ